MALDPQKLRAFAPLMSGEEYRRRQQRLRRHFAWNTIAAVCFIVVDVFSSPSIQFGVGVQFGDRLRGLIALMSILCLASACFMSYFRFELWYDQLAARRAHAYADKLEGRMS